MELGFYGENTDVLRYHEYYEDDSKVLSIYVTEMDEKQAIAEYNLKEQNGLYSQTYVTCEYNGLLSKLLWQENRVFRSYEFFCNNCLISVIESSKDSSTNLLGDFIMEFFPVEAEDGIPVFKELEAE